MTKIGFMGLGTMGLPMAMNIARSGLDLIVYNRTTDKAKPAQEAGARVADTPEALFAWADTVVMMLAGPQAIDHTLGRLMKDQPGLLKEKLVVNMGTNPPAYSRDLADRLGQAGSRYVEAPVFGSKEPAQQGALIVMASGSGRDIEELSPLFSAVGSKVINCGDVPKASTMKLAVNLVTIAAGEGLAEGMHFAQKAGLDLQTFFGLIQNGPVGNSFFAMKIKKYLEDDYSEQASVSTVHEVLKHIADTAYDIRASLPNTLSNLSLITRAMNKGLADEDACAIVKVL
jgi:3-hydroxyisobutyrate dehydrogenase